MEPTRDLSSGGVRNPLQPQLQRGLCHHLHGTDTSLPGLRIEVTAGAPAPHSWEYTSPLFSVEAVSFLVSLLLLCKNLFFPLTNFNQVLRNACTLFYWFLSLSSSKRRHYQAPLRRLCTDYIIHPLTTFQTFTFTVRQVLILGNVCLQASFYINVYTNCWWIWISGRR